MRDLWPTKQSLGRRDTLSRRSDAGDARRELAVLVDVVNKAALRRLARSPLAPQSHELQRTGVPHSLNQRRAGVPVWRPTRLSRRCRRRALECHLQSEEVPDVFDISAVSALASIVPCG